MTDTYNETYSTGAASHEPFAPTQRQAIARLTGLAAGLGALLVLTMVGIIAANGVGPNDFESLIRFGTPAVFAEQIAIHLSMLRTIYPFDTIYVLAYVTMTFGMIVYRGQITPFGVLAIIAVLATALLDFVENNHIIAMGIAASNGIAPSATEITVQTVITQTKFNAGLLLTFVISILLDVDSRLALATRWLARLLIPGAVVAMLAPSTTLLYISANIILFALMAVIFLRRSLAR